MISVNTTDTIAAVTAAVADEPSEFSQKAGNVAKNAITQMTDIYTGNQIRHISRDLFDKGKGLLAAIGMVSKSAAVNLDPSKTEKNNTNTTENDYLSWNKAEVCYLKVPLRHVMLEVSVSYANVM